ncbi:hypothetical protein NA56DRAFT_675391 [Hyaloscypha hepaticicola]|uniref:MFS general substrate transporter n=1 Tax=Hyaloscypha hepaticicola TaxID=2082293 RepID=A0A2J6PD52_9HELO|nr:hypothetical protein NA56DRAFT_675391 [Hyaloscypha hepaticicola]
MSTTCDSLQDAEHPALVVTGPPDGGYSWVCVAACFTINCFSWGVVASYGVFLGYYLENGIYPAATTTDFAFIGGLRNGPGPPQSLWHSLPMLIGVCLQTAGFITALFAARIWHLYLTQGILVGLGVVFTYISSIAILSQWFDRRGSVANGISAAGSGIGGLFCHSDRNHIIQPKQHPFDRDLLRGYDVILALAWAFVSMLSYIILLFSMSNFASSIGLDKSQAPTVTALLNLGTALRRPFIRVISDYCARIESAGFITLLCAISVFAIWMPATSYGVTILFVVVNGAILGVFWITIGPIFTGVVGLGELPPMLSLAWLVIVLPTTYKFSRCWPNFIVSEVIALKLRCPGSGHEFLYPQIFAGLAYLIASIIILELWRVRRRSTVIEYALSQGARKGVPRTALTVKAQA